VTEKKSNNIRDHMEELRKITILIHKIMIIQTYQYLWTTYLKSGTGQIAISSAEQPIYSTMVLLWPKELKTYVKLENMKTNNENDIYFNFVHHHLQELDRQLKQYQSELNIKTNHFQGYTLTIQQMIETYIEQNLQSFRMKIEHQIEIIYYDCHIRALKLEYFRHQPNKYQVCFPR
jgi:hypothetical protein